MKIKCVVKQNHVPDLVYGEVYDVISVECDWYRIIDGSGDDYMYHPNAFEIVEPYPKPPVLTREDVKNGLGSKYRVTRYADENVDNDIYAGYAKTENRKLAFA